MKYILILSLLFVSCKQDSDQKNKDESTITAQQVLFAMGGYSYQVKIPEDTSKDDYVGPAFRYSDGTIKRVGGASGFLPGEIVTFVFIKPVQGQPHYAIIGQSCSSRGEITLPSIIRMESGADSNLIHAPGDMMRRFSSGETLELEKDPKGNNYDLILHIYKRANKSAHTNPLHAE